VLDSVVMSGPRADEDAFRQFVDRHRAQCLWFLRPDYYPDTRAARIAVLRLIEKHGDSRAFQEAARYRQWRSPTSSETPVDA
jgi:transposase InsO family protein